MGIIIKEMSLHWIIGLLALWSGVIKADNVTAAPEAVTRTSNENSSFIIIIKITNHVYNDSLEDHQSHSYKTLRQDVEDVFSEIFNLTSVRYQAITEMTFSNGSVIANCTVLFGTEPKSGQTVKDIFVNNHQRLSLKLDLNINYTTVQGPVQDISKPPPFISSPNEHPTTHSSDPTNSTISNLPSSDPDKSLKNRDATTYATDTSFSSKSTSHHSTTNSTTMHPGHSTPTGSASHHASSGSTVITSRAAEHSTKTSTKPASSSSVNPGKTETQEPKGPEGSGTGAIEQFVPSWGIAVLALAAIILFFMLVLLILLLLFWCCWWRQRGFGGVSDPDPTGYYNPDIPMFSTYSTYETHNGKPLIKP